MALNTSPDDPSPSPPVLDRETLSRLTPGGALKIPSPDLSGLTASISPPALQSTPQTSPPSGIDAQGRIIGGVNNGIKADPAILRSYSPPSSAPSLGVGNPSANRQLVVNFWKSQGVPEHVAEGIADAIAPESGFNPAAWNPNDAGSPSGGLYQHHAERLERLKQFAASKGVNWTDPNVQNEFANRERLGGDPYVAQHWNEIANAPDRQSAKAAWQKYFERGVLQGGAGGFNPIGEMQRAGEAVRRGMYDVAGKEQARAQDAIGRIAASEGNISKALERVRTAREQSDSAMQKATSFLEKQPKPPEIDGVQHAAGLATIVGLLGGLLTRAPLTASLNAAGAAIGAYNDGDRERYKLAYDNWKTQDDLLFKIAEMQVKRADDIMSDERIGLEQRRSMLDLYLRATGQANLADEMRIKGDEAYYGYSKDMNSAIEKRREHEEKMEEMNQRNMLTLAKEPAAMNFQQWRQTHPNATQEEISAAWKQAQEMFPKEKSAQNVILYDPVNKDPQGNPIPYVFDLTSKKATTMMGEPYTPSGAQKMTSGALGSAEPLTEDAINTAAERILAGDHSAVVGLGYGTVGANNRTKINNKVAELARQRGMSGQEIAARQLEFAGRRAEIQTMGRYQAAIEQAAVETSRLIPQVLRTSEAIPRTELPTLNSALLAGRRRLGDTGITQFDIAVNSFLQAYGRALNPRGTPHVADVEHARELLQTSFTKGQVWSAMMQLNYEIQAARAATDDVWSSIIDKTGGKAPSGPELLKQQGFLQPSGVNYPPPPSDAIRDLRTHPEWREKFNQTFGPGAAEIVLGAGK